MQNTMSAKLLVTASALLLLVSSFQGANAVPPTRPTTFCTCINPFLGTGAEYVGDSTITCPRLGACYVPCNADCNDLKPAKGGGRCYSRLACRPDIILLKPAGKAADAAAEVSAGAEVELE
jgi:hypothetical protein